MAGIESDGLRTKATRLDNRLVLVIPARIRWYRVLSSSIWIGLLFAMLFQVVSIGFSSRSAPFSFTFWSILLLGLLLSVHQISWNLTGREIIKVEHSFLTRDKRVIGINLRQRDRFDLFQIRNIRAFSCERSAPSYFSGKQKAGSGIAFEYDMKTYLLGDELDHAEAKILARMIEAEMSSHGQQNPS